MSYILDALRKSDQLRRRNAAPTLLPGLAVEAPPKQAPLLSYGVLALVLLGAGIAIGWLRPWQSQPAAPAPAARAVKPPEPRAQAEPLPQLAAAAPQAQYAAPAIQAAPAPAAPPLPMQRPQAASAVDRPPHTVAAQAGAPVTAANSTPAPVTLPQDAPRNKPSGAAPPEAAVMTLAELPVSIQQELPTLSISVHAYSGKAADRLVGINGRLLHEGDALAPGLTLERITPDGMILSYKGYTFRRGVR